MKRLATAVLLVALSSPAVSRAVPKCGDEPYLDPATQKLWITWVTPISAEDQVTLLRPGQFPSLGAASDGGIGDRHERWRKEVREKRQLDDKTEPPALKGCAQMAYGKSFRGGGAGALRKWEKVTYNIDPVPEATPILVDYDREGRDFFAVGLEHRKVEEAERHGLVNATPVLTHAVVVPGAKVERYVRSVVLSRDDGRGHQHCFQTPGVKIVSSARADGGVWLPRRFAALHQEPVTQLVVDLLTDAKKPPPQLQPPGLSAEDLGIVTLGKVSYRATRITMGLEPRPTDDLVLTWK
jgi:hypothetical protein